jgi:diguanylate cyclase (GGDEF)-like protein/PAS domain S-box-containing protein
MAGYLMVPGAGLVDAFEVPGSAFAPMTQDTRLFELSTDLLATLDRDGRFTRVNPAWERALGWTAPELIGRRALDLVHRDDAAATLGLRAVSRASEQLVIDFENRYLCKDGRYRWLQWNARLAGGLWYAVARDVTERRRLEDQATRDPLTGLANRTAFIDALARSIAGLDARGGLIGVLFVDLDHFKVINDGYGHEVGDRLLRAVAARLCDIVRDIDTVGRFGGDEFVILVGDADSAADIALVGERAVAALDRAIVIAGNDLLVGASVGIAIAARSDVTPEILLHEADIAMYRAKARGGRRADVFDESTRAEVARRVWAERELRDAVARDEIVLLYQPIVALPEMSVVQCEALVRWRHPTRGLLLPEQFVPLAEESGLIVSIGAWVLEQACRQAALWRRQGRNIGIAVNVAARELRQPGFVDSVSRVLTRVGLPPQAVCLEITETGVMASPATTAAVLGALKGHGVRIAMDDFGTGYSSLSYLTSLPLDVIKIDRSFVRGILDNSRDRAIVAAILRLGRDAEMSVVAEGVETEALHAELVGLGCQLGQGYLYGRPATAEDIDLDGYSSRLGPGVGDPLVIREFMRQIGIPARIRP